MSENKDYDASLGDQNTFQGQSKPKLEDIESRSLGDQVTLSGANDLGGYEDDGMEVVDLSARYRIESTLGKGGMGEVLLATDTRLDRKVAIKRILGDAARSRTAVNRFLTEAKSIAALNHPNIVQIYDYGRAADGPFLIMEFVDGESLLDLCKRGALPAKDAVDLACQLCDGLTKAHNAGIIHRDIKPANILLTTDGTPKLTDFGLAKAETADTGMTMAGAVLGTLDFMPPEQRRDAALTDARSDLWSLAATLYQMVTGESPRVIDLDLCPKELRAVLSQSLKTKKEDRYQNARDLRDALRQSLTASDTVSVEQLGAGECPSCHTKNEANRKFCKKCAQALEVSCLSCSSKMPMWEEVCGQCGTKQSELVAQRKQSMAAQREKAEELLEKLEFQEASELATELGSEPDPRLQHLKAWSDKFLQQLAKKKEEEFSRLSDLIGEALKHEQAYDYPSAVHTLEQIPEVLRSQSVEKHQGLSSSQLQQRVQKKQDEAKRLENLVRQRIASKQVNGLQTEVDQFLKLVPNHADMLRLKQRLIDREAKLCKTRDEAFAAAQPLMEAQDYEGVVRELERVDSFVMQPEITTLKQQAIDSLTQIRALQQSISKAVQEKRYHGLLSEVEEFLKLKRDDAAMKTLRSQLISRDEKNASQIRAVVEKAKELRQSCRFQQAKLELSRIPEELQTQEVQGLLESCESLELKRQSAMMALAKGLKTEAHSQVIVSVENYRNALISEGIQDPEFSAAAEAAERNRKLRKQLSIGASAVAVVAVLIGSGLWLRSVVRANSLANAISGQKWDEALAIDPNNAEALLGRAVNRLNNPTPNMKGAFEDLKQAEAIDSSLQGLKEAKSTAYTKRAEANAVLGKITEAESDLSDAKNHGANDVSLESTRKLLAEAYIKQAEIAATSGNIPLANINLAKAQQLDNNVSIPSALLIAYAEEAVKAFEQSNSDENMTAATSAIEKMRNNTAELNVVVFDSLRRRIVTAIARRGLVQVKENPDAALRDYRSIISMDSDRSFADLDNLRDQLSTSLSDRAAQSLDKNDVQTAILIYSTLSTIDTQAAERLQTDVFSKSTPEILSKLPLEGILKMPPITNSIGMQLKIVPPGSFTFIYYTKPITVRLTKPFYIGVYEVTQEEYKKITGSNPSDFQGPKLPVEKVSWKDAVEFCRKLSELPAEKSSGRVYRLPTEGEWEYAARAGQNTRYSMGDTATGLDEFAWYADNSNKSSRIVGQKKPNALKLYDVHGNVWEWCADWYGPLVDESVPTSLMIDPIGPRDGARRVFRGGAWSSEAKDCSFTVRGEATPEDAYNWLGFRVVMSLDTTSH